MHTLTVREIAGLDELGLACADDIIRICAARQAEGAVPCIALTGGRAGAAVLAALGERAVSSVEGGEVDWSRVRFIWGDERWLPDGDTERNDLMAETTLFAAADVDRSLVHRVASSDAGLSLDEAAAEYAATVAAAGPIDITLCGVGEDGHVASLFPGREDLLVSSADVADALAVRDSPKPPAERVSMTLPALNRAKRVWLLACGSGKADAIAQLRARREPLVPAARVAGTAETMLWADAAALAG